MRQKCSNRKENVTPVDLGLLGTGRHNTSGAPSGPCGANRCKFGIRNGGILLLAASHDILRMGHRKRVSAMKYRTGGYLGTTTDAE